MADILGGLFSGAGNVLAGVIGAKSAERMNRENIQFQEKTNQQNIEMTQMGWARDDNAVQRRTADLQAAGLNPILAAGGAASSGAPIQAKAPQMTENPGAPAAAAASAVADIVGKQASIAQTRAQTKLTNMQAQKVDLENQLASGTLAPKVQEAQAAAKVAVESAQSRVDLSAAQAASAKAEADNAQEYFLSRSLSGMANARIADVAQKIGLDKANWGSVSIGGEPSRFEQQWEAELWRAQAQAALAAAMSKTQTISAEALARMNLSPEGWKRLVDVMRTALQALNLFF